MMYDRYLNALTYLAFCLGGVASIFFPYTVIVSVANQQTAYVWAGLMALGGLISFIGALMDSWTIEQIGLPLLIMCFITLSIVATAALIFHGDYFLSSGLFSLGNVAFFTLRYIRIKKSIVTSE